MNAELQKLLDLNNKIWDTHRSQCRTIAALIRFIKRTMKKIRDYSALNLRFHVFIFAMVVTAVIEERE